MTNQISNERLEVREPEPMSNLSAAGTLFWLTARQHARSRRLLILLLLSLLPGIVVVLIRTLADPVPPLHMPEFAFVFMMIPHVLVPLTGLLYATGMIQDELEEQTLTYLLVRPLPRWSIYVSKLLATILMTWVLAALLVVLTYIAVYAGDAKFTELNIPKKAGQVTLLLMLNLVAYCTLFGLMSLFIKRTLVVGVAYIFLFEGLLANIDFVIRKATIVYYFRVLAQRLLDMDETPWTKIDLADAPGSADCVWILLGVSAVAAVLGALIFTSREFRVKTPEGS